MKFKIFIKDGCPTCPLMKKLGEKLSELGHVIVHYDVGTTDGLSESIFYDVVATPSMTLVGSDDEEIHTWRINIPDLDEVLEWVK